MIPSGWVRNAIPRPRLAARVALGGYLGQVGLAFGCRRRVVWPSRRRWWCRRSSSLWARRWTARSSPVRWCPPRGGRSRWRPCLSGFPCGLHGHRGPLAVVIVFPTKRVSPGVVIWRVKDGFRGDERVGGREEGAGECRSARKKVAYRPPWPILSEHDSPWTARRKDSHRGSIRYLWRNRRFSGSFRLALFLYNNLYLNVLRNP